MQGEMVYIKPPESAMVAKWLAEARAKVFRGLLGLVIPLRLMELMDKTRCYRPLWTLGIWYMEVHQGPGICRSSTIAIVQDGKILFGFVGDLDFSKWYADKKSMRLWWESYHKRAWERLYAR